MAINRRNNNLPGSRYFDCDPALIPAVAADLLAESCWLEEVVLSNVTGAAVTVTIKDKQSTPRSLCEALSVAANSVTILRFAGRYCPGGLNWVAGSANAIVGSVRGRV